MKVTVHGVELDVIKTNPLYFDCHPSERGMSPISENDTCEHCVIAKMPDGDDSVILWGCGYDGTRSYAVSRDEPEREQKLERINRLAA